MLAAYRIDTSNILHRYAASPSAKSARLALAWLKEAALTEAHTKVALGFPQLTPVEHNKMTLLSLGIMREETVGVKKSPASITMDTIYKMSPEKQKEAYLSIMKSVGMEVDPSVFVDNKKETKK